MVSRRWTSSCHGLLLVKDLILDRGEHSDGAVAALAVVEDLEVVEDRVRQLDACLPSLAVQQLGLYSSLGRLDDRVVEAITNRPHRSAEARFLGAAGERP